LSTAPCSSLLRGDIRRFDCGMVVSAFLGGLTPLDLDGLRRTVVQAGEAVGTAGRVRPDRFSLRQRDLSGGTHAFTGAAAGARLIRVKRLLHIREAQLVECGGDQGHHHVRKEEQPGGVLGAVGLPRRDSCLDAVQGFPHACFRPRAFLWGIGLKNGDVILGHLEGEAGVQPLTPSRQQLIDVVENPGETLPGGDGEDIGRRAEIRPREEVPHRPGEGEGVDGEHQADDVRMGFDLVLLKGAHDGDQFRIGEARRQLPCGVQGVAGAGKGVELHVMRKLPK
jgi:hypothetical protein